MQTSTDHLDQTPETVQASKIEAAPKLKNYSTLQKCVCYHPRHKINELCCTVFRG